MFSGMHRNGRRLCVTTAEVTETVYPASHERATPSTKTLGFVPQPNLRDYHDPLPGWLGDCVVLTTSPNASVTGTKPGTKI